MDIAEKILCRTKIMTPEQYVRLYENHGERIKNATFIPPRLGVDKHFGKMKVVFNPGCSDGVGIFGV